MFFALVVTKVQDVYVSSSFFVDDDGERSLNKSHADERTRHSQNAPEVTFHFVERRDCPISSAMASEAQQRECHCTCGRARKDGQPSKFPSCALIRMRSGSLLALARARSLKNTSASVDQRPPTSLARTTKRQRLRGTTSSGKVRSFLRLAATRRTPSTLAAPWWGGAVAVQSGDDCRVHRQLYSAVEGQPVGDDFEPTPVLHVHDP